MQAVAVSGPASADPVEELLRAAFHVEARILLGLVTRKPRDSLHEVEDALCRAWDYAEVVAGSRFRAES
jgi:hypothetical protein